MSQDRRSSTSRATTKSSQQFQVQQHTQENYNTMDSQTEEGDVKFHFPAILQTYLTEEVS